MRLAFIGDELEVRWTLPRFAHVPWMAMYRYQPSAALSPSCPAAGSRTSMTGRAEWAPMVVPEAPAETLLIGRPPCGCSDLMGCSGWGRGPFLETRPQAVRPLVSGRRPSLGEPRPVSRQPLWREDLLPDLPLGLWAVEGFPRGQVQSARPDASAQAGVWGTGRGQGDRKSGDLRTRNSPWSMERGPHCGATQGGERGWVWGAGERGPSALSTR